MKNKTMKKIGLGVVGLSVVVLLAVGGFSACGSKDGKSSISQQKSVNYTYAQKDKFAKQMQFDIANINKELEKMGATAAKATGEAKVEANRKIKELRVKADELNKQIEKAKETKESDWDNFKASINKSFAEVKEGVDEARASLSKKIAP